MEAQRAERESGIELLKILAIFLIVFSHVLQTLAEANNYYNADYVIDLSKASTSFRQVILAWLRGAGAQGNHIFFICSAWFLLESEKVNAKKIFRMLADVWIINIVWLNIITGAGYFLSYKDIVNSVFPSITAQNWYITLYILFYLIHVGLNWIIQKLSQKQLLSCAAMMFVLYFGICYLKSGQLFCSDLITFTSAYFIMAYVKKYLVDFCQDAKKNLILLTIGGGTPLLLTAATNYIGLRVDFFSDKVTHWVSNNSPFLLLTAISLFNLFSRLKFKNKAVNYISGLSLLIYVIHENHLFRQYVRPQIWIYLHNTIEYDHVGLIAFMFAVALFFAAMAAAVLYKALFQKWIYKASDKLSDCFLKVYDKVSGKIMEIK